MTGNQDHPGPKQRRLTSKWSEVHTWQCASYCIIVSYNYIICQVWSDKPRSKQKGWYSSVCLFFLVYQYTIDSARGFQSVLMDILAYQANILNNIESPINLRVSIRKILQVYRMHIYIYSFILWPYPYIIWCLFFYQEMTWTTRQRKSVSVVLSKRSFMAYSAKITPQESPRKFAVMNPKVKNKGVRVGSAAMLRSWGDEECMCRFTWIFQGCRTQQHLPWGWNCMEFWHV